MVLLRALVRLITFVLLVALALLGLAVAVFSLEGGDSGLSLPQLASYLKLPELRDQVGTFLGGLESEGGGLAKLTALSALGAVLLGLLILRGVFGRRRERLVGLETGKEGTLAARRRPLGQVAAALVQQAEGVTDTKVKIKPKRGGKGGRVRVTAFHSRTVDEKSVRSHSSEALAPLTDAFALKARVQPRTGERGSRVQ